MHHREAFGNGLALWRRHLPDPIWHASLSLSHNKNTDAILTLPTFSSHATVTVADVFSFYNTVGELRNTTIGWWLSRREKLRCLRKQQNTEIFLVHTQHIHHGEFDNSPP